MRAADVRTTDKLSISCNAFGDLIENTLATCNSRCTWLAATNLVRLRRGQTCFAIRFILYARPFCYPLWVASNNHYRSAIGSLSTPAKPKPRQSVNCTVWGFLSQVIYSRIQAMSDGSDCIPDCKNRQVICGTLGNLGSRFLNGPQISFAKFADCRNTAKSDLPDSTANDTNARCLRGLLTSLSGTTYWSLFTVRNAYTRIAAHSQYLHPAIWQLACGTLARGPPDSHLRSPHVHVPRMKKPRLHW